LALVLVVFGFASAFSPANLRSFGLGFVVWMYEEVVRDIVVVYSKVVRFKVVRARVGARYMEQSIK
jgi:hypothetical protein